MIDNVYSRSEQKFLEKGSTLCIYSRPIPFFTPIPFSITQYITRLALPSTPLVVRELP